MWGDSAIGEPYPRDGILSNVHNEPMVDMLICLRQIIKQSSGRPLRKQANKTVPAAGNFIQREASGILHSFEMASHVWHSPVTIPQW